MESIESLKKYYDMIDGKQIEITSSVPSEDKITVKTSDQKKDRRKTFANPDSALQSMKQETVFCRDLIDRERQTIEIPTYIDFSTIVGSFPVLFQEFLKRMNESHPNLVSFLEWQFTQIDDTYSLKIGKTKIASLTRKKWYKTGALTRVPDTLLSVLKKVATTPERFCIFRYSWFSSKTNIRHMSMLVIDTAPSVRGKVLSEIRAYVVDVNGNNGKYEAHFPNLEGGANNLFSQMVLRVLEVVQSSFTEVKSVECEIPKIQNLNLMESMIKKVEKLDNELSTASGIELEYSYEAFHTGICAIATLLIVWTLVCYQRQVLKRGGFESVYKTFNKNVNTYDHVMFVRSWLYQLLKQLPEKAHRGVGGELVEYYLKTKKIILLKNNAFSHS